MRQAAVPCTLQVAYDALISTIPLDTTLRWLGQGEWADGLQHSSSHIIGFGECRPRPLPRPEPNPCPALACFRRSCAVPGVCARQLFGRPRPQQCVLCAARHASSPSGTVQPSPEPAAPANPRRCRLSISPHPPTFCRHRRPRALPSRPQVLALLSRGRLPLLPRNRLFALCQEELPSGWVSDLVPLPPLSQQGSAICSTMKREKRQS